MRWAEVEKEQTEFVNRLTEEALAKKCFLFGKRRSAWGAWGTWCSISRTTRLTVEVKSRWHATAGRGTCGYGLPRVSDGRPRGPL